MTGEQNGKSTWTALLIGVGTYDPPISQLPYTVDDVSRMQQALTNTGYETIDVICTQLDTKIPTRNVIRNKVQTALESAPTDSTLVIYFTGHGLSIGGADYLCPADTPSSQRPDSAQDLIPMNLRQLAGESVTACKASTILFVIDACRDIVNSKSVLPEYDFRGEVDQKIYTIYACRSGEVAQYDEKIGGSLLTVALAEALQPDTDPRTIGEVARYAGARMQTLLRDNGIPRSQTLSLETEIDDEIVGARTICRGTADNEIWGNYATEALKFVGAGHGHESIAAALSSSVIAIQRRTNFPSETEDVWSDQRLKRRWLQNLTKLDRGELSIYERFFCVITMLLASAALDISAAAGSGCSRTDIDELAPRIALYEKRAHARNDDVSRRAQYLADKGQSSDARTIETWLRHQAERDVVYVWRPPLLIELTNFLASNLEHRAARVEHLDEVLGHLAAGVVTGDLHGEVPQQLHISPNFADEEVWPLRPRRCFAILHASYQMTLDLRTFGEPLVLEIGLRSGLDVWRARQELREINWQVESGSLLRPDVACSHGAVDRTIRDAVANMRTFVVANERNLTPFAIGESGIVPSRAGGIPAYQPPVPSISLNTQAVRRLLVGRDLYGSPTMAIRELYQNALDACRYRAMREKYLALRYPTSYRAPYEGQIQLSLCRNSQGELVLDCLDNGVGMGDEEIEGPFTSAGTRFTDLLSFNREQDFWHQLDPTLTLFPNSRFGIGVFSYFLLAEEVVVYSTRQSDAGAVSGNGSMLHMSSVSGLVTRSAMGAQDPTSGGGGTLVRLMLNEREWDEIDQPLDAIVESILGYAEFKLVVSEFDHCRQWLPGTFIESTVEPTLAFESEQTSAWWVDGSAPLLADGIRQQIHTKGYQVNLGGTHRPRLSVSRNEVEVWDRDWVEQQLQRSTSEVHRWPGLSLYWFWELTLTSPHVAESVYEALCALKPVPGVHLRSEAGTEGFTGGSKLDVTKMGIVPADAYVLAARQRRFTGSFRALGAIRGSSQQHRIIELLNVDVNVTNWRAREWARQLRPEDSTIENLREMAQRAPVIAPIPKMPNSNAPGAGIAPAATPLEGAVLTSIGQVVMGIEPAGAFAEMTVVRFDHLVRLSSRLGVSIEFCIACICKFSVVGFVIPPLPSSWSLDDYCFVANSIQESMCTLTSDDLEWWPFPSDHDRQASRWLLRVLSKHPGLTPADLASAAKSLRLDKLATWIECVGFPPNELVRRYRPSAKHRQMRSQARASVGRTKTSASDFIDLLGTASLELDESTATGAMLATEDWLDGRGYAADFVSVRFRESVNSLRVPKVSKDLARQIISRDNDGVAPWITEPPKAGLIVHKAWLFGVTVEVVVSAFRDAGGAVESAVEDLDVPGLSDVPVPVDELLRIFPSVPGSLRSFLSFCALANRDEALASRLQQWIEDSPVLVDILGWPLSRTTAVKLDSSELQALSILGDLGQQQGDLGQEQGEWPVEMSSPMSIVWMHNANLTLSEGRDLLTKMAAIGITSLLPDGGPVEEFTTVQWLETGDIAGALHGGWSLHAGVGLACERIGGSAIDILNRNAWWLKTSDCDSADDIIRNMECGTVPSNWDQSDDRWLGISFPKGSTVPVSTVLRAVYHGATAGVSVARVLSAAWRSGEIPLAGDLAMMGFVANWRHVGAATVLSLIEGLEVSQADACARMLNVSRDEIEQILIELTYVV